MRAADAVDGILCELVDYETDNDVFELRLFKSIISANQYRQHYLTILRTVAPESKVLDWGCGGGHFSYGLARLGYETTGYAFDDFELRADMPASYRFVLGSPDDPVTLPFDDAQFDAVISMGVLEHVRETGGNEHGSMGELARVLRPGGHVLCFHLPNRRSVIETLNTRFGRGHHLYSFDGRDVERLCRECGLELVDVGRYGALPRNAWNRMPERVRNSQLVARTYDAADRLLGYPLSPICQNYRFVARKPLAP